MVIYNKTESPAFILSSIVIVTFTVYPRFWYLMISDEVTYIAHEQKKSSFSNVNPGVHIGSLKTISGNFE